MLSKEIENSIRKMALKNALDYGTAKASAVMGKALSEFPELKHDLRSLPADIERIIAEINSMPRQLLEKEAERYTGEFSAERAEKAARSGRHSYMLNGASSGAFATRFPPEPNGYMHIGHAKAAFIEQEVSKIYRGSLFLYFDDTNPEAERQAFADAIKYDLNWLGISFEGEYYASDSIERLYAYAESLIKKGHAYVCLCGPDDVKKGRQEGRACEHREAGIAENEGFWKRMLGREQNEGILRLHSDMKAENTAMRDPTLFRIKKSPHYRQGSKYQMWPTYDFNTPVMDSIHGITDAIRSKEYELRDELYYKILDLLGLRKPHIHSISRLEIRNNITSKRKLNELISKGLVSGYDDPRLVTIAALRRRGITPAAIRELALRFGMSKAEGSVGIEMLLSENRKEIDAHSKRLFLVKEPVGLKVSGMPGEHMDISIKLHPTEELGYRNYKLSNVFFINAYDANRLESGQKVRLKDAFDIRITGKEKGALEAAYENGNSAEGARIAWVNENNYVGCTINMVGDLLNGVSFNSESIISYKGYVESYANQLSEGETVQFGSMGFFKLDIKKSLSFLSL